MKDEKEDKIWYENPEEKQEEENEDEEDRRGKGYQGREAATVCAHSSLG